MNLGGKELDALLAKWPATLPGREKAAPMSEQDEERTWEERADKIVSAALAAKKQGVSEATDALFSAPALAAEPGEEAGSSAGEKKMSQEKESGDSPSQAGASAPPPAERKRQSLKEIAARASQAGRPSSPGTPPPSSVGSTRPPASSAGRLSQPPASAVTPLPRPVEAGKDDSGVINLKVVHATATAAQVAAAEKAKPAQAGLFEDEKTVESAENPAEKPKPAKPTNVAVIEAKKSNSTGAIAGIAIAVMGIAAAFAIVSKKQPAAQPAAVSEVAKAPAASPPTTAAPTAQATAAPQAVASAEAAPSASAEADKPADAPKAAAAGNNGAGAPAAAATGAPSGAATTAPDAKLAAKGATPSGKPGDLQSEMAKAVGKDGAGQAAPQDAPKFEPAAGGGNQNIPEQPSQGAVQSAMKAVLPAAKACVAGADDVSRAQVTFSSNGSVSSVSVSGWAASNGKSACIQSALKGAKVGPFSKPSFAVGVPIRP
jgi:hypothetical protein